MVAHPPRPGQPYPPCGTVDVASDCLNVVRSCEMPAAAAMDAKRMYGGVVKPVRSDPQWEKRVQVRKVPAHVDPRACHSPEARADAIGNGQADEEARQAVKLHPQPSPAQLQDLEAALKRSRLIVRTIAAVMPQFPAMPREGMQRRPRLREGAEIAGDGGHQWKFAAGCWRCTICWTLTVKSEIDARLVHRRCPGPKLSLAAASIVQSGHKLAHAAGQLPFMFCITCGAFSARRAYGLAATCRGTPSRAGAQALAWASAMDNAAGCRQRAAASRRGGCLVKEALSLC